MTAKTCLGQGKGWTLNGQCADLAATIVPKSARGSVRSGSRLRPKILEAPFGGRDGRCTATRQLAGVGKRSRVFCGQFAK